VITLFLRDVYSSRRLWLLDLSPFSTFLGFIGYNFLFVLEVSDMSRLKGSVALTGRPLYEIQSSSPASTSYKVKITNLELSAFV
jgi:hypothetical protein